MQKGRIRQSTISQQTRCKTFSDYTSGSDPWRGWNTAECKYTLEALLTGGSTKHAAERPKHLNRSKTQEIHYNTLRDFLLQSFGKKLPWFRCSGKGEHLNRNQTQKNHYNTLIEFSLHGFNKHLHRFRCSGKRSI